MQDLSQAQELWSGSVPLPYRDNTTMPAPSFLQNIKKLVTKLTKNYIKMQ